MLTHRLFLTPSCINSTSHFCPYILTEVIITWAVGITWRSVSSLSKRCIFFLFLSSYHLDHCSKIHIKIVNYMFYCYGCRDVYTFSNINTHIICIYYVAQCVKNPALSLLWLCLPLWHGFDPSLRNFCKPWV